MSTTTAPAPAETAARAAKAARLVEAFEHLARTVVDVPATPVEVYDLATTADGFVWSCAEALAGTRPASPATRATVLAVLFASANPRGPVDPFEGF